MTLELKAETREIIGKKTKTLRQKGFIPAIVYGPGRKAISLQVNYEDFRKILEQAGESTLIKLNIEDHIKDVLIHEISKDPIDDRFIHVDFYEVRMDKAIKAEVSLVFDGEAPAVKNLEGILIKNVTEVEVEALPKDLPHEIRVDISGLDSFEKHIRIKDLNLPSGVKITNDPEEVVLLVKPPRTEQELKELEEKPIEKVEEVEKVSEKPVEGEESIEETKETKKETKEEVKEGDQR